MGVLVIVVMLAAAGVGIYIGIKRRRADKEAGVVARIGKWRLTPRELLIGNQNDAAERVSLVRLEASFGMSGSINRDSGRYTVTRFALLGPFALAAKKGRNKKIDDREGYLMVVGPQTALLQAVRGRQFSAAQTFALELNKYARMNDAGTR